jgi:pyridoxamine 5'-phosphate oxidase family protein
MFTQAEYRYLLSHPLGRLASIGPDGAPQIHPVAFVVDLATGFIDIGGPRLYATHKARNIRHDPRVSLVVDDQEPGPVRPGGEASRGIEIRGSAQLSQRGQPINSSASTDIIRIRPARVISWNIDGPGYHSRFVG